MKDWYPLGVNRFRSYVRPAVGEVVALDMRAWTVAHVADAELQDEESTRLAMEGWKDDAYQRRLPYMITLHRMHGPKHDGENNVKEVGFRVPAFSHHAWEKYDEGRVPLCSCCGHPWPCMVTEAKKASEEQAALLNAKMDRAAPGQCYSCGEVITHRQGSVTYPEPNIELLGYPAPRFHTRKSCADGWYSYERKRAKALPDAEPVYATPQSAALWSDSE